MPFNPTDEQQAVINHPPGQHGRVIAGPGTGKSATAVALAERLVANGEEASKVKFLTFTRAATAELAKKLASAEAERFEKPSTIHSFAIGTLLRNPGIAVFPQPLRIPDKYEYKTLIRPHLAKLAVVGQKTLDKLVREMAAKWTSLNPEEHPQVTPEERARFMGAWLQHRRVFGYTLLDELPDLLRIGLRDHQDIEGIDYKIMIVDEYQDLNACDLEIMNRLAERAIAILAIGDDDQSIYSFRKAHPAGIRQFLQVFDGSRDYKLTFCHRCPSAIVNWAQFVIQGDIDREVRPTPTCRPEAEGTTALLRFRGNVSEAKGVADLVGWLIDAKHLPPSEILILTRTDLNGTFTTPIKEKLRQRDIPISDPNSVEVMLSDVGVRRLLSILRLKADSSDSLAWWTIILLRKGMGPSFIQMVFGRAVGGNITFGQALAELATGQFADMKPVMRERAIQLWEETNSILGAVQLPAEAVSWGEWIINEIQNRRLPDCLEEFKQLLIEIDAVVETDCDLNRYLSQVAPLGRDIAQAKSEGVRFMTMTSSKGLTVRATIIVGVDNDLIPRPEEDLAEERRLLYVAMTRSQEYLFLTWSNIRRGPAARSGRVNVGARQPSEFLRGGPVESEDGPTFIQALITED